MNMKNSKGGRRWLQRWVGPLLLIVMRASQNPLRFWKRNNVDRLDTPIAQPSCEPPASPSALSSESASSLSQNKMGKTDACPAAPNKQHGDGEACGASGGKKPNMPDTRWCKTAGTITAMCVSYPAALLCCRMLHPQTLEEIVSLLVLVLIAAMSQAIVVASGMTLLCWEYWYLTYGAQWPNDQELSHAARDSRQPETRSANCQA